MSRRVAVIGSGAIGTISAVELLRAGHDVTIIDPGPAGGEQAASYGNAGWLSCQSVIPPATPGLWRHVPSYLLNPLGPLALRWSYLPRATPWLIRYLLAGRTWAQIRATAAIQRPLLKDAVELHSALAREAGVPELIAAGGVLQPFASRAAWEAGRISWDIRAEVGLTWHILEGAALRDAYPALPDRFGFALDIDGAGRCRNPGAYIAALGALARDRGAHVETATVRDFRFEDGHLSGIVTDRGEIACDAAVIAAGARSGRLSARLGEPLPVESERGYHVMVEGAHPGLNGSFMDSTHKVVVQEMAHGLRIAGQVEIAGVDAPADGRRADILKVQLGQMFPGLDLSGAKTWLGHRPSTPDGRPCLGYSRRTRDVVYAFGHGHVGLVSSARTGRLVAALVDGRTPEIPLEGFAPSRFG